MFSRVKWLTYLSLDAPLVAVCWQALLARSFDIPLAWYHSLILLAAVWLGYAADRFLDNLKFDAPRSDRHRFYAAHSALLKRVWLGVLAIALLASFLLLSPGELAKGFFLVAAALVYCWFAQKARHLPFYGIAKSAFIAVLIVESAVLFLPVDALPMPSAFFAMLAVAALFTNNCLLVRSWSPEKSGPSDELLTLTGFTALGLALLGALFAPALRPIAAACILSLGGLFLLSRLRGSLGADISRSLADILLLSPILVYPFAG